MNIGNRVPKGATIPYEVWFFTLIIFFFDSFLIKNMKGNLHMIFEEQVLLNCYQNNKSSFIEPVKYLIETADYDCDDLLSIYLEAKDNDDVDKMMKDKFKKTVSTVKGALKELKNNKIDITGNKRKRLMNKISLGIKVLFDIIL